MRRPKVAAVPSRGSGFAPEGEMKALTGGWGHGRAGAGFFSFWEGPFPVPSEKGLGIVKTKPPLAVSGFSTFH